MVDDDSSQGGATDVYAIMNLSISRGRRLAVGQQGVARNELPPPGAGPVDLAEWFAPDGVGVPIELEIGTGKGTFLVQQAMLGRSVNYIGVEYARSFWRYAADRCRRKGLTNVRIVHADAESFLRDCVPCESLSQVHIYFPDPWPKTRHHKRRLIRACFLAMMHERLKPLGRVRIVTDHSEYFQWICRHVGQVEHLYDRLAFVAGAGVGDQEWVGSNFERKYRREGRPLHGMTLSKRSSPRPRNHRQAQESASGDLATSKSNGSDAGASSKLFLPPSGGGPQFQP